MRFLVKLWKILRDEWIREGREHPIMSRVFLFGIPLIVVIRAILIFFSSR